MSGSAKLPGSYADRRAVPRYMFIATADIVEPATDTRMSGRVSEISRFGCYIDILNTLPKDTAIRVRISNDSGSFESAGKIIYVQENMGMGVGFVDPAEDQVQILNKWLSELSDGK
ncbi:MAG TPA: PilZ domain-containing protein [Candidatus Acidoferrales bacterium]|nr:PilZ domain-containing protein [Candidatus Acidoferrales bacterium]